MKTSPAVPRPALKPSAGQPQPPETAATPSSAVLTLGELLQHECMTGHAVVAGHRGLVRPVRAVAVLDAEDLEHVGPGQLLLSSAYSLLDLNLLHLVAMLHRGGAVALGVKLSSFWDTMPDSLVRAANSYGFPLIVLPEGPFYEILHPLLTRIAERQVAEMQRSAQLHHVLTGAALHEDGDPRAVLHLLDRSIGRRVAVFTAEGDVLWRTGSADQWPRAQLVEAARRRRNAFATIGGEPAIVVTTPGATAPRTLLCALDVQPEDAFARAALAHAAVVIGMLRMERRHVSEVHERFAQNFLEDLVSDRLTDANEVHARAAWIGWPADTPYVVVAARRIQEHPGQPPTTDRAGDFAAIDASISQLRPVLGSSDEPRWQLTSAAGPAAVVHLDDPKDATRVIAQLRDGERRAGLAGRWHLGVSDVRTDLLDLRQAVVEGALAALVGANHPGRSAVRAFRDLGPLRLLTRTRNPQPLGALAADVLGPLATEASPASADLLSTLTALTAHSMNLRATAEDLYFHYNTIRHRLSRIRRQLGPMLDDRSGRLTVSLAVAATQLLRIQSEIGNASPGGVGSERRHEILRPDRDP